MILYKLTPLMMVIDVLTAPILVILMWDAVSHKVLMIWLAVMLIASALTSIFYLYLKPFFKDLSTIPQELFYYQLPLVFGLIWGSAGYFFFTPDSEIHLSFLIIFLFAIASGAVIVLSSLWLSYILFAVPILSPFIILFFTKEDPKHFFLAITIIIFLGVMITLSRLSYGFISRLIGMRYENNSLVKELKQQKDDAIEANKDKSRFLSAASHDLRQPIHSLSLLTSAIAPEITSDNGKKILTQIDKANRVMLDLLNSLLDISKLDAEIVDAQFEVVEVGKVIQKIMGEFKLLAKQSNLELRAHCSPCYIETDPVLLENILRNLIQNAIHYTSKGKVLVSCRKQKGMILMQVWDTGKGIPAAHQELVFAEFQQLQNPERNQNKGLGLGLAICRRLSTLIGAELSLKSELNKGSVFTVKVPEAPEGSVVIEQAITSKHTLPSNMAGFEQSTILVIEDNLTVLDAMVSLLEGWGCKVLTAESIADTIEIAESYQGRVDAIVADYSLRERTTGVEAMDAFNERVDYKASRALITGDTGPERMKEIIAHGIPVLHKPIKSIHLKTALASMLRQQT